MGLCPWKNLTFHTLQMGLSNLNQKTGKLSLQISDI
jgi:hypothetical protein